MNNGRNVLPTLYNGVAFRSKPEAHWAALFDLCGWKWAYCCGPHSADAPTFLLGSVHAWVGDFQHPPGGAHRAMALRPSGPFCDVHGQPILGNGVDCGVADTIAIGTCGGANPACKVGMSPTVGDYTCWACGHHDGNPAQSEPAEIETLWQAAVSAVARRVR